MGAFVRALLHVHSNYSYDGVPDLEDLAAWGEERGLDFIFLSEHANDFDDTKMDRFVRHCDQLAGHRCRLIPGLEFAVRGGFHFLGFHLRRFEPLVEPADTARFIREQGGIGVIAHPGRYGGRWPDSDAIAMLHGIEGWNAAYDGRFLPSGAVLRGSRGQARIGRGLSLFGGQDLHRLASHRLVATEFQGDVTISEAVGRLRRGEFWFGAGGVRLRSDPEIAGCLLVAASVAHGLYALARKARDGVARIRAGADAADS
jgi:hypothetical protein